MYHVIVMRVVKTTLPEWMGFNWLLPQCNNLRNRFPAIRISVSASMRDIISYLCERDLNLFVASSLNIVKFILKMTFSDHGKNCSGTGQR